MGYKRCLEVNEFGDLSLNKAKRLESNNDLDALNVNLVVKNVVSGGNEGSFYNIQWYDAIQVGTALHAPPAVDSNVQISGHFSCFSEDDAGSGATSLSSASSDCLEFEIPQKSHPALDDAYSASDCSLRKPVPVGPNHQAVIPAWSGKLKKISNLCIYNDYNPSSGLVSVRPAHDNEERLMGTCVLPMPDSSLDYSAKGNKGEEGRSECNCLDQGAVRCVRHHVREARENMKRSLGMENFVNLGFCDMGEDVALKWSEEEGEFFHEVIYSNPASVGRNFWKHLSAAFPARTNKEIVSYYFNVFILRRRAAQNRSRFLDIDSDDDECHTSNPQFYSYENSEDDSGLESLGHSQNQDYSDADDDDGNSDDDDEFARYNMGNINKEEGGINQRSSSYPIQHLDGSQGICKDNLGAKDNSCTSFERDADMDISCSHGLVDASSALQGREFKCDQSPCMPSKHDLSSHEMDDVYLLEPGNAKDWYPGYSTCLDTNVDFLPTFNLIEEFFGLGTPDRKTRSD
ncbi:PREDICTED: uncharacterized protein LOC109349533 isoform X2 [Lupinus angustifolius]|uniref:uncharacterized protein LOC109349533 isoform X2 n=1 Tax=Lupinus angustifolius TaxID=3871 RepID=UPI00092ECD7F|nr:PREDICTED: uncharacterized protein LOC109349533 isoform X2 [Lupinus angustifolius]